MRALLTSSLLFGHVAGGLAQTTQTRSGIDSFELREGVDSEISDTARRTAVVDDGSTQTEPDRFRSNTRVERVSRTGPVGTVAGDTTSSTRSNTSVDPQQTGIERPEEEDLFAADGILIGRTNSFFILEQSIGHASNLSRNVNGDSGTFSQTDVTGQFTSDWSRHEWQTNVSGSYRRPFNGDAVDEQSLSADSALRLDLIDGFTLTGSLNYSANTQEFTDSTLAPGAVDTPLVQSYGGALELERSERKLRMILRGSIDRTVFEDADLGAGASQSQEDQNNTLYSGSLRVGYEATASVIPFIQGGYAIREHDLEFDRNGNRRDSDILELRAGLELEMGDKLQGEFSVGYLTERFNDPQLEDLNGITFNGSLEWSPQRDSVVTFTAGTSTNTSIVANESGDISYVAQVDYARQINHRLSMDMFAGIEIESDDDRDTTFEAGVGLQYWVNRFMAITGDVEYFNFSSGSPNSDIEDVSARLGVRLQR